MCKSPSLRGASDAFAIGSDLKARPLLHRFEPCSAESLEAAGLNPADATFATLDNELYGLTCAYVAKHTPSCGSFKLRVSGQQKKKDSLARGVDAALGLGVFEFEFRGVQYFALHGELGEPVGSDCGATFFRTLVLAVRGRGKLQTLLDLTTSLVEEADKVDGSSFTVYRWNMQCSFWGRDEKVRARPMASVVLPEATKAMITEDLDDFSSEATAAWYADHGIPYRRSYLLYGVPGSGKTSLLQAIAGRYRRNLCYCSPTHPDMTDDMLKNAVGRAPAKSLIVLEDVDALFGPDRQKKIEKSPLTFSGLLNALDGVGQGGGQLFVLTSNHREQLDPALVRAGRVDIHVAFDYAQPAQMEGLFAQFYPAAAEGLPRKFAEALTAALGSRRVSMAALQHYFILCRKASAEKAAADVELVVQEHDKRLDDQAAGKGKEAEPAAAAKETDEAAGKAAGKAGKKGKANEDAESGEGEGAGTSPHIHVHLHGLGKK